MGEWPSATLADACSDGGTIQTGPFGSQLHKADYKTAGIPVIMPTNIREGRVVEDGIAYIDLADAERLGRHRTEVGDIIFSRRGEVDKCAVITAREKGWLCGTGCLLARPNSSKANPYFLGYSINTHQSKSWLKRHAVGATMPNLNTGILERLPVPWPDKAVQDEVAGILQSLDDKIELNRRMNETLEAQARALFSDWFVDFGPVKAKMADTAPYLAPDLWSLFPNRLDDDGVPEGWEQGTLDLVSTLNPESWTAKNAPQEIEYVDLANTKWGYIESTVVYEWDQAPSRARRVLRPGDTIVGTVRPGNGSFSYIGKSGLTGSTGFAVLRPKNEHDRTLSWCAATDPENIWRLSHLADGGAYPAVRPDAVLASPLAVPPKADLLRYFQKTAGILLDRIENNKAESETLAHTRDLLLPKLMSGEIRLSGSDAKQGSGG